MSFNSKELGVTQGPERSEEERRDFMRQAVYIVRLFAPHFMKVVPNETGLWACGLSDNHPANEALHHYVEGKRDDIDSFPDAFFQPDYVTYGQESIGTYPIDALYGLLRHEVGHAKRSSFRNIYKGARHAKNEGCLPTTLLYGMNAAEDCWMENAERAESIAGQRQLDENLRFHLPRVTERLKSGMLSPLMQLGMRIIMENAYHRGLLTRNEIDELEQSAFRKEVVESFRRIAPDVETYGDPLRDSDNNYDLYLKTIWPEIKKYEDQSITNELLSKILNPRTKEDKELQRRFARELAKQIKREMKQHNQEKKEKMKEAGGGAIAQAGEAIQKRIDRLLGRKPKETGESEAVGQMRAETKKRVREAMKGVNETVDMGQLPKDLRDEVMKELNRLEKEMPDEFGKSKKAAKRNVDQRQTQELKPMLPGALELGEDEEGINMPKPRKIDSKDMDKKLQSLREFSKEDDQEQSKERDEMMEKIKEANTKEDLDQIEKENEPPPNHRDEIKEALIAKGEHFEREERKIRNEMVKLGFEPEERSLYEEYREIEQEVKSELRRYVEKLYEIFPKKTEITYDGAFFKGPKIRDRKAMVQKIVTGQGDIYQRPEVHELPKPKIFLVLLIDRSASMQGEKMRESLKTAVLFNMLGKYFQLPCSIIFYDDTVEEVKTLLADFNVPEQKIKAKFMRASKKSGSTDIGKAIAVASDELNALKRRFPDMAGIMLAITDGLPTAGEDHATIKGRIDETNKKHPIIALYLCGEAEANQQQLPIEDLFGTRESGRTVAVANFSQLREHAFFAFKRAAQFLLRRYS